MLGSLFAVLQLAAALGCGAIVQSCIQYLEAVRWEESDEDEIVTVVSRLGPITMPVLARIQPVDFVSTKNVFISALRLATSVDSPCPPLGGELRTSMVELRTSAQEQVEYMLGDDEDMPLVTADNDVKLETITGLSNTFSMFERELSLLLESNGIEGRIMHCLSNLEWMSNILLKMGLMNDFVSRWIDMSESALHIIGDKKLEFELWDLKVKLVHVTSKVLDAVGYGTVILPAPRRMQLIRTWLPYIRKLKPALDLLFKKDAEFPHKMDEDLSASIEGSIISLVSALPSDDQANILADWMNTDQLRYPDLSEAFEIWCFRTKSAKRRLIGGLDVVDNTSVGS